MLTLFFTPQPSKKKAILGFTSLFLVLGFFLAGCDFTQTGMVPAYISVDSLKPGDTLGVVKPEFQGRGFPDVSIYVDGKPLGIYELGMPADAGSKVVPFNGKHTIKLYGTVRADGLASQRVSYPFYKEDSSVQDFTPEGRINFGTRILKESKYLAKPFPVEENFENSTRLTVDQGPNGSVPIVVKKDSIGSNGQYWKKGGFAFLTAPANKNYTFELAAKQFVVLPQNANKPLYAEIDYRSNMYFTVGFYNQAKNHVEDIVVVPSPDKWKRIYVFLADEAATPVFTQGEALKLFIGGVNVDTTQSNYLALDNIRLLHFRPRL